MFQSRNAVADSDVKLFKNAADRWLEICDQHDQMCPTGLINIIIMKKLWRIILPWTLSKKKAH